MPDQVIKADPEDPQTPGIFSGCVLYPAQDNLQDPERPDQDIKDDPEDPQTPIFSGS